MLRAPDSNTVSDDLGRAEMLNDTFAYSGLIQQGAMSSKFVFSVFRSRGRFLCQYLWDF